MPQLYDGMSGEPFDILRGEITRNLLEYAVGRQMFCPMDECEVLMDAGDAVLVTPKTDKEGQTLCVCGACYDKIFAAMTRGVEIAAFFAAHDIIDGREYGKGSIRSVKSL